MVQLAFLPHRNTGQRLQAETECLWWNFPSDLLKACPITEFKSTNINGNHICFGKEQCNTMDKITFKYYFKSAPTGDYKIFEFIKKKQFIRHISQFLRVLISLVQSLNLIKSTYGRMLIFFQCPKSIGKPSKPNWPSLFKEWKNEFSIPY